MTGRKRKLWAISTRIVGRTRLRDWFLQIRARVQNNNLLTKQRDYYGGTVSIGDNGNIKYGYRYANWLMAQNPHE